MVAEVFHSVLTSSLHAAVVGLVILLLKAALKNRLNAQWHYLIWIVLILKLIMPFGPASAVSLFNIIPEVNPPERMIVDTYQVPAPIAALQLQRINQQKSNLHRWSSSGTGNTRYRGGFGLDLILGMSLMLFWLVGTCYSLNRNLSGGCREPDARIAAIFESCKSRMGSAAT